MAQAATRRILPVLAQDLIRCPPRWRRRMAKVASPRLWTRRILPAQAQEPIRCLPARWRGMAQAAAPLLGTRRILPALAQELIRCLPRQRRKAAVRLAGPRGTRRSSQARARASCRCSPRQQREAAAPLGCASVFLSALAHKSFRRAPATSTKREGGAQRCQETSELFIRDPGERMYIILGAWGLVL